ncbi:MAG: hypothetical protein IIW48_10230 [Clostridia bacterium]|nr:hypothetical protein [Clostridia bacterium]
MNKEEIHAMTQEYNESIRLLDETLADCREALKRAKAQRRRHIISKLNANIAALYRQRKELTDILSSLNAYYAEQEEKKAG